jgi:hypothetical protein
MSLKSCFSVRIKDHIRFVIRVFDLTRCIISCDGGVDGSLVWFVSRHNIRCSYIKLSVPWKWSHKCVLVFINAMLCGRIVRTQAGVHTGNLWSSIVIQIYKLYDIYILKLHTSCIQLSLCKSTASKISCSPHEPWLKFDPDISGKISWNWRPCGEAFDVTRPYKSLLYLFKPVIQPRL